MNHSHRHSSTFHAAHAQTTPKTHNARPVAAISVVEAAIQRVRKSATRTAAAGPMSLAQCHRVETTMRSSRSR